MLMREAWQLVEESRDVGRGIGDDAPCKLYVQSAAYGIF
eukprot:CAMPEP_0174738980 /NCGR_PEP_ID=MMETSP1094-20130205/70816_1 /TAXON_ID=156173 /ORGANISM="Chrysochromulina brevifilum, Strain UTEX LB 985" /LENGTH=38 /DNA_ID= /DNA_START= /DNA_END= /DNA_ORIENTATION=